MSANVTSADLADLFEAFNRHDIEGVMKHLAEDCIFYTVAGPEVHGTRVSGTKAIAQVFVGVWTAMPDAQWADHSHFVAGDRGVSEWTFRGTDAEGRRIEAQGADIFTFRGSQIVIKQALRKQRPVLSAK